ncbi:DNA-binding transcriptional regulator [Luteolibacter arcticus]|uniref:DNA-binding transcriptional regulator n=1 Tax=Luteolibacter arcticus TaxID=1581411 RepID=A0ABT3GNH9_9BACT|nr:DNA-binding transcriptional regulator [Luteolibacter arcticus]MCW1925081.1 DNA-binding transcriptional regulator [Luteolibacter arcticus]
MPARKIATAPDVALQRHLRIGVRLPEWATGFVFRVFEGLIDFQRSHGAYVEMHFDQPSGGDLPAAPIDEHWQGDGLLVFRYTAAEAAEWKERKIAVVNLSTEFPGEDPDFPRVTMDNVRVGRMAVEHLASLGLRDFAYVHESTRRYSLERLEAFEAAVPEVGGRFHRIDVPVASYPLAVRPKRIERCISVPLASLPKPCGIFCKDDIMAVWVMRVLKTLGLRCPEEMPVLGVSDDIVFCHTTTPAMSSISYPGRRIGRAAAELLHRMMNGEKIPPRHRVTVPPAGLARRESTGRVILSDPVVTRALDHLRENIVQKGISVDALARRTGVSRELLRQRFHAALGRSPKEEIERLRCLRVCDYLHRTTYTLESIAEECGFSGPDDVCRFIKRMTGKTPGKIRAEAKS